MKRIMIVLSVVILILVIILFDIPQLIISGKGYIPSEGFVPDEETAIRIAEAVWLSIYGDSIYSNQPFKATYHSFLGYWEVIGSLPENMVGGVPVVHIRKSDGKILYVFHGK